MGDIDSGTRGKTAGFYVAADGRGLPDDGDRVFEDGYTTDTDGTGFGMSIVDQIVSAHGWEVDATVSDAGGARFDVSGIEVVGTDDHAQPS
ncbi:sensor histidine kinase [Natrinema caseinilyticum]|uniref:sensor histidine kinase n=1 Tax=Natrinema caseinilyticum TaxID=2961570 RepID=UPI0020C4D140|nr:ATP-binding protein [Natrinema caseinilyticum]